MNSHEPRRSSQRRTAVASLCSLVLTAACFLGIAPQSAASGPQPCETGWVPSGSTAGGVAIERFVSDRSSVFATTLWTPTAGQEVLVVAGRFAGVGDLVTTNIAVWDGQSWSALGDGLGGVVYALEVVHENGQDVLYAAGRGLLDPPTSTSIVRWTGTEWEAPIASGGDVFDLEVFDDGNGPAIYAATNSAYNVSRVVHRLTDDGWVPLPPLRNPVVNSEQICYSLKTFDDGSGPALYASGNFFDDGLNRVARWDGQAWQPLGLGLDAPVHALEVFDDGSGPRLIAGGSFDNAGGAPAQKLASWDGTSWSTLGFQANGTVFHLNAIDSSEGQRLYIAGQVQTPGSVFSPNIVRWNGNALTGLTFGVDEPARTVTEYAPDGGAPDVFVGGDFTVAGFLQPANHIARWDGSAWSALNEGLTGRFSEVNAIATLEIGAEQQIVIAGQFQSTQGTDVANIARFENGTWLPLGTGTTDLVFELITNEAKDRLFAAGRFIQAGGEFVYRVAAWDGTAWSGFDGGMNGEVNALASYNDGNADILFAGGEFTVAGSTSASNIAMWDGSAWHALGDGVNNEVADLALVFENGQPILYAGGRFTSAGGDPDIRWIARWDGQAWSGLGEDSNIGPVGQLAIAQADDSHTLYAASFQESVPGGQSWRVRSWDGASWQILGSDFFGFVVSMAVIDDGAANRLFVGGTFDALLGGPAINYVAEWDGDNWVSLGSGADNWVTAMAIRPVDGGQELLLGGHFVSAGSEMAYRFARWRVCDATSTCPADVNADGEISLPDLNLVLANFGSSTTDGDANGDGTVDLADLNAVLASFGTACPG